MTAKYVWLGLGGLSLLILLAVAIGVIQGISPSRETLSYFSPSFINDASIYEKARLTSFIARNFFLLLILSLFSYYVLVKTNLSTYSFAQAIKYIFIFFVLWQVITLPFSFYSSFILEHRFGFSNHTVSTWIVDYFKSALISIIIYTAGFSLIYLLMTTRKQDWWLISSLVVSVFLLLSSYLYPVLIEPLFGNFSNLEDEALQKEITSLVERAGVEIDQVLVLDASRRTQKANAYFSGIGNTRRVVLFDNLVNNFEQGEILAIVAHEVGHWKKAHVAKGTFIGIVGILISFWLLKSIIPANKLEITIKLIPIIFLFFSLVSLASMPIHNAISRSFERQADSIALELTEDKETFINMKVNLAKTNLSVVQPHPLVRGVLYTHPPTIERIQTAEQPQR